MDANDVLRRYATGERDFRLEDWHDLKLTDACLRGIDLAGANLKNSDLSGSSLLNANLNFASLKGSNLKGTALTGAKMPDGRIHNDFLESANYFG